MVLEKTRESPLDCEEIQLVHPKGNQSWVFIGRTDAEAETPKLWPPDVKNWLIRKDPNAGEDWRQEKGTTEDETVGWHHWLDGHEFEQAPGVGDRQGGLACWSPWGHKESDTTEQLNWIRAELWGLGEVGIILSVHVFFLNTLSPVFDTFYNFLKTKATIIYSYRSSIYYIHGRNTFLHFWHICQNCVRAYCMCCFKICGEMYITKMYRLSHMSVCSSVVSIFTLLCPHLHHPPPELFQFPKRNCPFKHLPPPSASPAPGNSHSASSLWIWVEVDFCNACLLGSGFIT